MSHLYLLGVASLTLTSAGFAGSDMNADLQTRLEAAEARIAELSADQNQNWLNDERADAVRSLVQDVLADADTRASLQGGGSNAGYDGGFTIASGDGNWSLTMNGMVNTRWTSNDDETAGGAGDTDGGFSTPTSWMNWSGTIAGDWSWDVRHDWDDGGLDWANASWNVGDGWDLTIGQFRLHTSRTAQIDDWAQMQLDGRDIDGDDDANPNGLSLAYSGDDMRFWGEWTNGGVDGSANDGEYNTNIRFEYMSEGNWGQFDQFTSAEGGAAGTLHGFTYNSVGSAGPTDGDTTWGIDVQMQFGGSSLYVAYSDFSDDVGGLVFNQTDVMWAMYLDSDWEVYIAYSDNDNDDGETTSIGVNNYWAGQNAKWTTQYTTDETDDSGDNTTISTNVQLYF